MSRLVSTLRAAWHAARFKLFARRLRRALRMHGAELVLDAPYGAVLRGIPAVEIDTRIEAHGSRTLTLRIGPAVEIGRGLVIELRPGGSNLLEIGAETRLYDGVRIELRGGTVRLGDHGLVRNGVVIKSSGELEVGSHSLLSFRTVVHCDERITIGRFFTAAEHCSLVDSDHDHDGGDGWHMQRPIHTAPISIGENVLISGGAAVLRGARIGRSCVVAAGAVVTAGEHPDRHLLGGIPARSLKALPAAEQQA